MFSTNPFPRLTSSIHVFPPPNSFLDHEKDGLYFNNHHRNNRQFVSGDCFFHAYSPPPATEKFTTDKQDSVGKLQQQLVEGSGLEHCDVYNHHFGPGVSTTKKKKISKKDHHSKIHTAQGPRDRRVRLSVEIARKFFCLQDFLGFDKASKTLDWLLIKSKIAIDELVEAKKHSSSSTVTDQSEVAFLETIKGGSDKGQEKSATKCVEGKRKKMARKYKPGFPENQSRAEARARARERTKEKLHIKKLDDESKKVHSDCCFCPVSPSDLTLQSSFWSAIGSKNDYNDRIGESITEQKISLPSSMLYSYQRNLAVSNDLTSKFTSLPKFTVVQEQQVDRAMI